jgi:histidinol dehydrogenase
MEKMHAYREKLEAQLQEWRVKIELLEEKAARATGETREEMLQAINELRQKKAALKGKWDTLQQESGVAFDRMKEGVEKAAGELKSTLDKVISRFK